MLPGSNTSKRLHACIVTRTYTQPPIYQCDPSITEGLPEDEGIDAATKNENGIF